MLTAFSSVLDRVGAPATRVSVICIAMVGLVLAACSAETGQELQGATPTAMASPTVPVQDDAENSDELRQTEQIMPEPSPAPTATPLADPIDLEKLAVITSSNVSDLEVLSEAGGKSFSSMSAVGAGHVLLWTHCNGPRLLSLKTFSEIYSLCGLSHLPATALAVSPDGKTFASGHVGGTLYVHDLNTGEVLTEEAFGEDTYVESLQYIAGGKKLAIGLIGLNTPDADRFQVRSTSTGQVLEEVSIPVGNTVISPDGSFALHTAGPTNAHLWEMESGRRTGALIFDTDWSLQWSLDDIAIHPDGDLVAASAAGEVVLYDRQQDRIVHQFEVGGQASLDFSPDGDWLAASGVALMIWPTGDSGQPSRFDEGSLRSCPELRGVNGSVGFGPDGTVVTAQPEGIAVWDIGSGELLRYLDSGALCRTIAFTDDGTLVSIGSEVTRFDPASMTQLKGSSIDLLSDAGTSRIYASGSGEMIGWLDSPTIYFSNLNNAGQTFSIEDQFAAEEPYLSRITGLVLHPQGRLIASYTDGIGDPDLPGVPPLHIRIWDTEIQELVSEFDPRRGWTFSIGHIEDVEFNPSGDTLAVSGNMVNGGHIALFDVYGNLQRVIRVPGDNVRTVEFSPSGRYLLLGQEVTGGERSMLIYDLSTGSSREVLDRSITGRFVPGSNLVVGGGSMEVLDWVSGSVVRTLPGSGTITASQDGRLLAQLDSGLLRIWGVSRAGEDDPGPGEKVDLIPLLAEGGTGVEGEGLTISNARGNGWLGYDSLDTMKVEGPFIVDVHMVSDPDLFSGLILSGRINDPYKPWWQGILRLYLVIDDGQVQFELRDGSAEDALLRRPLFGLEPGEPFSVRFRDRQGRVIDFLNRDGNVTRTVNLSDLENLEFPDGLFPEGRFHVGYLLEAGDTLTVNTLSLREAEE